MLVKFLKFTQNAIFRICCQLIHHMHVTFFSLPSPRLRLTWKKGLQAYGFYLFIYLNFVFLELHCIYVESQGELTSLWFHGFPSAT